MKPATILHDKANLFLLPILGVLTVSGVLGLIDPFIVSVFFTCYIIADFLWIYIEPDAVPSLPQVILVHHVVTAILLAFPLQYEHLGVFTCWDGLCEINTFFLIARRQWKPLRKPLSFLYWATFFPSRIFLYPYLLYEMYKAMQPHDVWEIAVVCACQSALMLFNFALLFLSMSNWKKHSNKASSASKAMASSPLVARPQSSSSEDKAKTAAVEVALSVQAASLRKTD